MKRRLCRLCEFPAADGGVLLDALDADKWDEWCRRELGEELQISSDAKQSSVICQFCIWEARFVHESSIDKCCGMDTSDGCDWWTGHDNDYFFREHFYKKPIIQPCKVILEKISMSDSVNQDLLSSTTAVFNASQICAQDKLELQLGFPEQIKIDSNLKSANKTFPCTLCDKIFKCWGFRSNHIKRIHKNAVRCKSKYCESYFFTDIERKQHEEKIHLSDGYYMKCIFCGVLRSGGVVKLNRHIKQKHKEAIKCDFYNDNRCPNYFHTEAEKNKHILKVHNKGDLDPKQCIYCGNLFKNKHMLVTHVRNNHGDIHIKCIFRGCPVFFFNQNESDQHFLQNHQYNESLKKFQCPKCIFRTNEKRAWRYHLLTLHSKKEATLKCPLCPTAFYAKKNLKVHSKRCHGERCTCEHCGKSMQKRSMQLHFFGISCNLKLYDRKT